MIYKNYYWRRMRCLPLLSFLTGIVLLAIMLALWNGVRAFSGIPDLSEKPPGFGFKHVFEIPPPAGVKDLKVAGYANLGGSITYLRFQVDDVDDVLRVLKRNLQVPIAGPLKEDECLSPETCSSEQELERAVAWESVQHIKRPEYYGHNGYIKTITLIVDRRRRLMFAFMYMI